MAINPEQLVEAEAMHEQAIALRLEQMIDEDLLGRENAPAGISISLRERFGYVREPVLRLLVGDYRKAGWQAAIERVNGKPYLMLRQRPGNRTHY